MEKNIRVRPITALIISVDEPQLPRCLEAVRNQTVPFSDIIHMNNVSPENIAFNSGIFRVQTDWFVKIDGDMILYPNALELAFGEFGEMQDGVYCYNFLLYDVFLEVNLRGCGVMNTEICRKVPYPNMLGNDLWFGKKLRTMGYKKVNCKPIIGTHFDNPDELQVFRRFFCHGIKHNNRYVYNPLRIHYEKTSNSLYQLGLKALEFGIEKKKYPSSHNINFDKKMFEEFNADCRYNS